MCENVFVCVREGVPNSDLPLVINYEAKSLGDDLERARAIMEERWVWVGESLSESVERCGLVSPGGCG